MKNIMKLMLVIACIMIGMISLTQGAPFGKEAKQDAIKTLKAALKEKNREAKTTFEAVMGLFKLKQPMDEYKKLCETLEVTKVPSTFQNLYYDTATWVALKCKQEEFSTQKLRTIAKEAIKQLKTKKGEQMYYGARVLLLHKKRMGTMVNEFKSDIRAAFKEIMPLVQEESNVTNAAYLYEVATILAKFLGGVKAESVFNTLFNLSKQLATSVRLIQKKRTTLEEAATMARAIAKLTSTSRVKRVEPETIDTLTTILLNNQQAKDTTAILNLIEGLAAVNDNIIYTPVLVSELIQDKDAFGFDITNVYGDTPTVKEIVLKQAYDARTARDGREYIVEDEALTQDGIHYRFAFSRDENARDYFKENAKGMYIFELGVRLPDAKKVDYFTIKRLLKRTSDVSIVSMTLAVSELANQIRVDLLRTPLTYPEQVDHLQIAAGQRLAASLEFAEITQLSQVFLRLSNNQQTVTLPMTRQTGSSIYEVNVNTDTNPANRAFRPISGVYSLECFIGDVSIQSPIAWNLGNVEFTFDTSSTYEDHAESKFFRKLPDIDHQFAIPERRASRGISTIFVFVVAAPLVIFIIVALFIIKANCANFPFSNPIVLVSHLLFQAGIGYMIYVNVMYFFSWKLGPVLKHLVLVGTVTSVIGAFALGSLHQQQKNTTK